MDVRLGAFADRGVQSKRFSAEMRGLPVNQQCATDFQPCCSNGVEHEQFDAYSKLTNAQRAVMKRVISVLDTHSDSVVITNPLQPSGPIVYVTNAWQSMCGYTMPQAIDQNPRLTQGEGTDPETVRSMRKALTARQPCKVRLINYRGYNREPFWNCLSVHPIFFNRECVLFAARLQDYSYRLSRLVSLQPSQFCKAGDHFQMKVRLSEINSAKRFAQPRIVEVQPSDVGLDEDGSSSMSTGCGGSSRVEGSSETSSDDGSSGEQTTRSGHDTSSSFCARPMLPLKHVKRLGFGGLELEPEYLVDRLKDECATLSIPCEAHEMRVQGAEVVRMELLSAGSSSSSSSSGNGSHFGEMSAISMGGAPRSGGGLRALLHVLPEDSDGVFSISLMRLVGDTFEFHALYRSLRERLQDLTTPAPLMPTR